VIFETPRLILREIGAEDAAAFSSYNERPEFYRFLPQIVIKEKTQAFVASAMQYNLQLPRKYWYLAIVDRESNNVIGDIILHSHPVPLESTANIGFGMNPDYWNKGLMTEALSIITKFAHDIMGFHRVQTAADLENTGSWRVLEKCGYVREGVLHYAVKDTNGWTKETAQYASVRPDMVKN
jgi:ribosomal-protein-alanine N-acetyltransferase